MDFGSFLFLKTIFFIVVFFITFPTFLFTIFKKKNLNFMIF